MLTKNNSKFSVGSLAFEGVDGVRRVVAFDVLLSDVSKFTTALPLLTR